MGISHYKMYGVTWRMLGNCLWLTHRQFGHLLSNVLRISIIICIYPVDLARQVTGNFNNSSANMTRAI